MNKSAASTLELPEYKAILAFIAEPVKKKLEKLNKDIYTLTKKYFTRL